MSLLLDALNKADRERKRNDATPGIYSNHEQAGDAGSHRKTIFIAAVTVIGFLILLAGIYWLGQRSAARNTAAPATSTSASQNSSAKYGAQATKPIAAASQKTVANSSATNGSAVNNGSVSSSVVTANTNTTDDIDISDENVANLYQQNMQTQDTNASLTISTPDINAPTNSSMSTEQIQGSPRSITQFANLPDLHDLPTQVLDRIPTLNYSEHNFNINGGSVKINGTVRHANDQLGAGVVIDKILEDGMILHVENYSFKMRALNSWVNM